ncbi:hypothetical protein [Piscinibacter koreensis]|uniref:Uncharacterized protein n=1 Tax=Piscinibacter koreensis TaxID=2742824 RepID=A0A7Y6NNV7_9BURK|nr:hypothetical protein [Schlegelella koreensis]NUZ06615.1 hypothetical protein [Schlegelella koreensis]
MRILIKTLLGTLLALLLAAGIALALAVDSAPRVLPRTDVSPADVDRAVTLAREHGARLTAIGVSRALRLDARDVDLLVRHAVQRVLRADARARLESGRMVVDASVPAPLGRWLNVELGLRQSGAALPQIERVRVGSLPLPPTLVTAAAQRYAARRGVNLDQLLGVEWIEHVTFSPQALAVTYHVEPDTLKRLRAAMAPSTLKEARLRAYHDRFVEVSRRATGGHLDLAPMLRALFELAAARSADGHDVVEENRAALLTLTLHANQRPLGLLVPAASSWPVAPLVVVTLRGRPDSALHFLVSAVLAAEADTPLSKAVGVWKELEDAKRGGSGFSFNDLAADRAGTRFGHLAVREAAELQSRIAATTRDADLMPGAADLPEGMSEADFQARFGGIEGEAYQRLVADIDRRIEAMPMFR